jgi:hypothetical protein
MPIQTASQALGNEYPNTGFGFRNRFINGNFDIWQRSTSTSISADNSGFVADRWFNGIFGAGSMAVSRQENTTASNIQSRYFHRVTTTGTASASSVTGYTEQKVEDVRQFHNQPVTISFWAKAATATTYQIRQHWNFGSGGSSEIYGSLQNVSITTEWRKYSITFSPTDLSSYTIGTQNTTFYGIMFYWTTNQGSNTRNDNTFDIAEVQLEIASTATPYERKPYGVELALCQRYCVAYGGTSNNEHVGYGFAISTGTVEISLALPVQMRTLPSMGVSGSFQISDASVASVIFVLSLVNGQTGNQQVTLRATSSGLTQFRPYRVEVAGSLTPRLLLTAEL